jgi:hypothetical protein
MKTKLSSLKDMAGRTSLSAGQKISSAIGAVGTAFATMTSKVYANGLEYTGLSGDGVINGVIEVAATISTFIGAILLISSIFILVNAFRNEEVEGKHRAGLGIGVSIVLLAFRTVLGFFF